MDKEKEGIIATDVGFSEKQMDLAVDKSANSDQTKPARNTSLPASQAQRGSLGASVAGGGGNIFDPQKKKKVRNGGS